LDDLLQRFRADAEHAAGAAQQLRVCTVRTGPTAQATAQSRLRNTSGVNATCVGDPTSRVTGMPDVVAPGTQGQRNPAAIRCVRTVCPRTSFNLIASAQQAWQAVVGRRMGKPHEMANACAGDHEPDARQQADSLRWSTAEGLRRWRMAS
jgi:hypothetical protein